MNGTLLVVLIGCLLISLFGVIKFLDVKKNSERIEKEITWYKKAIQTKNGWSKGYGSYNIVTFDGGETWYNYKGSVDPEATRNDGFYFLTPTDTVLVKHINAWDVLTNYVEKNGPIDFSGKDLSVEAQKKLLEDAGFEIKEKQ